MRSSIVDLRRDLHRAVLNYADIRRLRAYRDLGELDRLFTAIIEAAQAVSEEEARLISEKAGGSDPFGAAS